MPTINTVEKQNEGLRVKWSDGFESDFDYLWLRDNCPSAFHPATRERNFNLLSIDEDIAAEAVSFDDAELRIVWRGDGHQSSFAADWLSAHDYSRAQIQEPDLSHEPWDSSYGARIYRATYRQLLDDDGALLDWLLQLQRFGLTIVDDAPVDAQALEALAMRVSHLRETNFGVVFDVMSKPNPNNQAYTAEALPLHTDLPNQELPPGFQFLHCLVNDAQGGESVFLDGFAAAQKVYRERPDFFEILTTCEIPFRFHDDTHNLLEEKPVIITDGDGRVIEINYNAHIASTFMLPKTVMRDYYRAYRFFMRTLHDESLLVRFKSSAGQVLVFDNRRVLHGRGVFDPQTGRRHLRGCYVDRGDLKSRIRILQRARA